MSKSRLPLIEELFILRIEKGYTDRMIKDYLMSPPYSYGLRNVQIYQNYLRKYIDENITIDKNELIKKQKEYLESRMAEFQINGQDKLWMEVVKEYNKLLGLYESQKVDITSNGKDIIPQVIYLNLPTENGTND
jgi:hypothetical protein